MNLKIQFELKRLETLEILLRIYIENKDLIDFGGSRYDNWINALYEKVIFEPKKTIKYYEKLINLEEEEIEEEIRKTINQIKKLKQKAIEEQNKIDILKA